jgi:DTW domain-containing protein YfiP
MKRIKCHHCEYPQSVCICDLLCTVCSTQKIIILQHPSEAKHAKNSAKLIHLCVPNSEIWVGETPEDFSPLIDWVNSQKESACLVYPSENSKPLEKKTNQERNAPPAFILLDATWRKAYKLWKMNPWLHSLPAWHFDQPPASLYKIRKTSVTAGLSTLEALAYTLQLTQNIDNSPMLRTFIQMQERVFARQLANQPDKCHK